MSSFLCFFRKYCKKSNTEKPPSNYQNTTDGVENVIYNNVNKNNSLPPSYETTNPAPDPSYTFGEKHESTVNSWRDAKEFSRRHPPNESLPTPEEIEDIIMHDGYKAWRFIP